MTGNTLRNTAPCTFQEKNMPKLETVPLICGAVYERKDARTAMPERMTITSTKVTVGGVLIGEGRLIGDAEWREFAEGDESMVGWSLVARPEELAEPISAGDIVQTENSRLKQELAAAKRYAEQLEREVKKTNLTDTVLVERVAAGNRWGHVGKPFGMGWKEVKDRWEVLVADGQKKDASQAAKAAARYARAVEDDKNKGKNKQPLAPVE